ncbi:hypothetical protein NUW58_g4586 [Xylaria curta]|uniref:Uncharacterized protein n=1 Tax=Xylaria curta TaxID=42375 RepID=A0ACC1P796_9PEZI|nr:hypothetical protein NUW58_g4586 [Xylaria curta]
MTDYTYDLNWGYDTTAPLAQIGNQDIYNTTRYTYGTYSGVFQSAWTQRPKNVPVFGEYRQMVPRQSGVDDSGYVFTSFIPFDQAEQRTRVAKFRGPSFVLDSRVSCQRPNFLDIKATPALYNGVPKNPLWYTFIGHVTNSTNVEGLWFPTNASRIIPFGCQYKEITSILLQRNDTGAFEGGLGFHICQIQGVDTMIQFPHNKNKDWAILQPTESAGSLRSGLYPYTVEDSFPARGPAFLVIASNFTLNQSHSTHEAFTKVTFEFDPGSNIIATNRTAVEDVFFSLCFTSWESSTNYVEMSTSSPLQEPSIEVLDGQFNLDSILHHYGIGELSTPRAVLSLKKPYYDRSIAYPIQQPATDRLIAEWDFDTLAWQVGFIIDHQPSNHVTIVSNPISDQQFKYLDLFDAWRPSTGNTTALFHYQAIGSNDESAKKTPDSTRHPDPSYQAFFTHAMNKTNNSPALSLSALLTFISSSAYYEQFSILKKNATGEVTLFENVSYPQSINGLAVVTSLVLGHWIICAYILYLFLSISNLSRLGNAWSNVAQVCGTVTRDVIQNGTLASDDEIEKLLSNEGKGQRCIIMSKAGRATERCEAIFVNDSEKTVVK